MTACSRRGQHLELEGERQRDRLKESVREMGMAAR
jgi:hypothetical protein